MNARSFDCPVPSLRGFFLFEIEFFFQLGILFTSVTSHYVVDQSMIRICDMKKIFEGDAQQNPRDSTYTAMLIDYLISIN
jgi:hypothetical protein